MTVCDGQLKLGVPGVYHPQEAKAAESFGFPEFLPFEETGLALTEEETNDRETVRILVQRCPAEYGRLRRYNKRKIIIRVEW